MSRSRWLTLIPLAILCGWLAGYDTNPVTGIPLAVIGGGLVVMFANSVLNRRRSQ